MKSNPFSARFFRVQFAIMNESFPRYHKLCSSHCVVSFEIKYKCYKRTAYKRTIRNYNAANYEEINNDLSSLDWEPVFTEPNINDVYLKFLDNIENCVNCHIPTKTVIIRPNDKPFINNGIRLKIRQRNRVHRKAKSTNNPQHWATFRRIRNEVITLIRASKKSYKSKLVLNL